MNTKSTEFVKSISYDQDEILRWIMKLYCPLGFELDPTYSKGNFYKNIPEPKYKFDILSIKGVEQGDCRNLPFEGESIQSILFDPPFISPPYKKDAPINSIITNRFGHLKGIDALFEFYDDSLQEMYRILKPDGVLVFKCQDTCYSGKQYLSHIKIVNSAVNCGFYARDLFVLLAKNRVIAPWHWNQKHARKFHSYFLVFQKNFLNKKINYDKHGK